MFPVLNELSHDISQEFKDMERDVLLAERILLQTLGFDLNVVHPYQYFRQIIGRELKCECSASSMSFTRVNFCVCSCFLYAGGAQWGALMHTLC